MLALFAKNTLEFPKNIQKFQCFEESVYYYLHNINWKIIIENTDYFFL